MASRLHLAARLPYDSELARINGASLQSPKWYQFKPRSMMLTPWLDALGQDFARPRDRLILADEGGMGKTKAAALLIHHVLAEEPDRTVLVLVQPRQVKTWCAELREVSRSPVFLHWKWPRNLGAGVHVVSKYQYLHAANNAFVHPNELDLSLVVLDEAHVHKLPSNETREVQNEGTTEPQKFAHLEMKLCQHADMVLGITATPLGMGLEDVKWLRKKLGDPNAGEELSGIVSREEKAFRQDRDALARSDKITPEAWTSFVEMHHAGLHQWLSISQKVEDFRTALEQVNVQDTNTVRALLADLSLIASFMTSTMRGHLGPEANEDFRMMKVKSADCKEEMKGVLAEIGKHESDVQDAWRWLPNPTRELEGDGRMLQLDLGEDWMDPRATRIAKEIDALDLHPDAHRGAVVFVHEHNGSRNLRYIRNQLEGAWKQHQKGKPDVKLKFHLMCGSSTAQDDDGQKALKEEQMRTLRKLRFSRATRESDSFHVLICTGIVEAGVNLDWANLLVHWEYSSGNPAALLQRNWRLDRHQRANTHPSFTVMYLATGHERELKAFENIQKRAQDIHTLFETPFHRDAWPRQEDVEWERNYVDDPVGPYLHARSQELHDRWKGPSLEEEHRTVVCVADAMGLDFDEGRDMGGALAFKNGLKADEFVHLSSGDELSSLYAIAGLAEGLDERPLLLHKAHPQEAARTIWFDRHGDFVRRLLRRHRDAPPVVARTDGTPCLVVSYEPVQGDAASAPSASELALARYELGAIKTGHGLEALSELYLVLEDEVQPISLDRHSELVERLSDALTQSGCHEGGPPSRLVDMANRYAGVVHEDLRNRLGERANKFEDMLHNLHEEKEKLRQSDVPDGRIHAVSREFVRVERKWQESLEVLQKLEGLRYEAIPRYVEVNP